VSLTSHIFGINRSTRRPSGITGALWQQLAIATNWPVLMAVVVLSAIGWVSIWAHAHALSANDPGRSDPQKQLIFIAVATAGMVLFQGVNYQKLGRVSWGFYIFALLLIVYTVLPFTHAPAGNHTPGRVPYRGGAFAWINLGPFSLQPSELAKIAFVMVLARYLRFRENYRSFKGLLAPFTIALAPIAVILKQPDLGTALIFIPALFAIMFVAGAKMWHLLAVLGMGIAVAPILWLAGPAPDGPGLPVLKYLPAMVKPYQRERVQSMFNDDPKTQREKGYQQRHALVAFGSGGVTGKGFGDIPVGRYVPESDNDMIFALVGEQFGLFGAAVVLGAYAILFAAGIEIASSTREPFGRLVAAGVVSLLAGQTILNIMVCLKLMPVTGVTLPFVSYGGSSLVASFMAAGLLLNIGQNRPVVMAKDAFEF
jgi:rod shape determining protein RodA